MESDVDEKSSSRSPLAKSPKLLPQNVVHSNIFKNDLISPQKKLSLSIPIN